MFAAPVGDYRVRLKECLKILGVLERTDVRLPLQPIRDEERAFLAQVLAEVGLLPAAGVGDAARPRDVHQRLTVEGVADGRRTR